MKNILNKIALVLTALNLVACDNANKDSASADIKGVTPDSVITDDSDTGTSVTSTSQLVAPKDMKFISHKGISLSVDLGNQGGPAYLSIYADYELSESAHWQINHNSRILASSMENTQISHNFSIPQHLRKLLIQVWFYDGREPLTKEVEIKNHIAISW